MMSWCRRLPARLLVTPTLLVLASLATRSAAAEPAAPAQPQPPRLAVIIVFDQLRGDYLTRWQSLFGPGGFRRLQQDGAWFQNCHYPYAVTKTAAGHASIATGCSPDKHGIISNDWYDHREGKTVGSVASDRHGPVPPARSAAEDDGVKKSTGVSPERLLQPTLADALKEATGGRGRVFAMSFKDRSAILLGGARADGCYWFDGGTGQFVTSTYYRDRVHPWVASFNAGRPADRWFGKEWSPLRPDLDYGRLCATANDSVPGESGPGHHNFLRALPGGAEKPGKLYYAGLYLSPFGNDLLLELAKKAVDAEELGRRDVPDLLCLSFSCNDPIGHLWGPDSQEVLDVTLRSDRLVKELLDHLDARVGKGRYVVALSADHGVCPLPEVSRAQGLDAGRVSAQLIGSEADAFLKTTFGKADEKARWVEGTSDPWVYLNRELLRARKLDPARVEAALAGWLAGKKGVQAAYTRTQLLKGVARDDAVGQSLARSFHPDRSGDVAIVLQPYYQFSPTLTLLANHGTPHPYDTHVPLLAYGPGIPAGAFAEKVTPQAVAPILAAALGIKPPRGAEAALPQCLGCCR